MIPSCRDTTARVTDAREGKLSMWEQVRYRFHMTLCHHCRRFARQLDTTARELRELETAETPSTSATDKAAVLEQFRKRER